MLIFETAPLRAIQRSSYSAIPQGEIPLMKWRQRNKAFQHFPPAKKNLAPRKRLPSFSEPRLL
jgi:hypothetical protein